MFTDFPNAHLLTAFATNLKSNNWPWRPLMSLEDETRENHQVQDLPK